MNTQLDKGRKSIPNVIKRYSSTLRTQAKTSPSIFGGGGGGGVISDDGHVHMFSSDVHVRSSDPPSLS